MGEDFDVNDLVGEEFDFYGVDGNCFNLDDRIYEALEGDTSMDEIVLCSHSHHDFHIVPIARVVVEQAAFDDEAYELIDLHDGHCWLSVGTEITGYNGHAYDTAFIFDYTPRNEVPLD